MNKNHAGGFTLIELLVVILIITILMSIGLPQYQKAILKSKLSQLDVIINASKKNVTQYLAANGWPRGTKPVYFTGRQRLDILDAAMGNCNNDDIMCETDDIKWSVGCSGEKDPPSCMMFFPLDTLFDDSMALVLIRESASEDVWCVDMRNAQKEMCQWVKERNYQTLNPEDCEQLGVHLERCQEGTGIPK